MMNSQIPMPYCDELVPNNFLLNWYQDVYIYLRTFCGTEPPLINLRETLSQEPHRLGGSKERSISKIIRDFWLNFTTENAKKQFIFC